MKFKSLNLETNKKSIQLKMKPKKGSSIDFFSIALNENCSVSIWPKC